MRSYPSTGAAVTKVSRFSNSTRVEVNPSIDPSLDPQNQRVFITAAKGTPVLPKDGSWSVVQHDAATKEVTPLRNNDVVPLIRKGLRKFLDIPADPPVPPIDPNILKYEQDKTSNPVNVAEASELFKDLEKRSKQFGFLQSTGENKVLFRNPLFEKNIYILKGSIPDLADAYHLMNSKGIFPKLENLPKIDQLNGDYEMNIIEKGYKLLNKVDRGKILQQDLPEGPWFIVKTEEVKVYIEYKATSGEKAKLDLDIDSTTSTWLNRMNDVTMVVDLGPLTRLLSIRGKFETKKGQAPSFIDPVLEFGPDLKPVVDILVLLSQISINNDYKAILKKGLKIAMSNSPNNWEYKFQADKEIPVLTFPDANIAAAPLRLEASLKTGVYFNVASPMPPGNGIPMPSAGAFVEFYAKLSVMCVSVGVATIYAVGQATVRISADTITKSALYLKFGFGVEVVVGLPVIGGVSVYFAVGVEISFESTQPKPTVGAFILFKGRADIFGGIVTVTIQIEASGKVQDRTREETYMIAQVIFALDISICFIIDISFSEQWQEKRQIS